MSEIFRPPTEQRGTVALPDAARILRHDNAREEARERAYWDAKRWRDERVIGETTKATADARLSAARQRGEALIAAQAPTKPRQIAGDSEELSSRGQEDAQETSSPSRVLGEFKDTLGDAAETTGKRLSDAAEGMASTIEHTIFGLPPNKEPKLSSVLLALIAIFLVPSLAVILVVLAILSIRGGHRLQAAVLGGVGCAIGLLSYAAAQQPPDESALLAELRSQCEETAVRIMGYVDGTTADGIVVDKVSGAVSDDHGSAAIITSKKDARAGQEWKAVVYPVGERRALNAFGMMRPMPAYADNLDAAVAILAENERARNEWWWQRLVRSLQGAWGTDAI